MILHKLAHLFNLQNGRVYSWICPDRDIVYIGHRCGKCGDITGVKPSHVDKHAIFQRVHEMKIKPSFYTFPESAKEREERFKELGK